MQGITLWEGSLCPLCDTLGIDSKLKFFRLNLRLAALLCKRKKCPFPLSTNYPDIFVRVGRDGKIIPGPQSERDWQHEEEDNSDDSPYISDASEESVTFPDIVPESKKLRDVSSKNKNSTGASEMDAFDISCIDFETDDSMDTFKLRNEITSLEMEITKTVENMKSVLPQDNCKGSPMLDSDNKNCRKSVSVAAKSSTSSNDDVCTDTHRPLDINNSSCVKMNEDEVKCYDDRKSDSIILRGQDSLTSITGCLELSKMSEELPNCMQQSEVKIPISDKSFSSNKYGDIQKNSNRSCQGGGGIDDGLEGAETVSNSNCSDSYAGKQFDIFSVGDTSNPEPKSSLILTPQDMINPVGNDLPKKCELHAELVTSESVNCNGFGEENCGNKEIVIIFDNHKNRDSTDSNSMSDISKPKPEPSVLLIPQDTKSTVENDLPRKYELNAESVTKESITFNKDNDCWKEKCDNKENDTRSSVTFKEDKECGNKKCDDKELDIIFDDQENIDVYEIVTFDSNTSPTGLLEDSRDCEVFDLELSVCEDQKSSGNITGRTTTKVHHSPQNTSEQHGIRNSVACSDSEILTPSVKVKIIEDEGLFVCTANIVPSSVSQVDKAKHLQETSVTNKAHSKNCVCFLCKETNKKGITSHLDRALADLFPEEHPTEEHLTERKLPTEREVMKDLVHYMAGNSSLQNTKKPRRKRKRLFHL